MKLSKAIDFQNVGALSRALRAERVPSGRFSIEIPERDAANGIYAAMKAEVEYRGGVFKADEDTKAHILEAARWLVNPGGKPGLLLCGLYGNGKTTLAKAISWLTAYLTEREDGYSGRKVMGFYTAKDICKLCAASERYRERHEQYESLFREPMLIIDDLGEEPKEVLVYGMAHTPITDLLGKRYEKQLVTVITTNLNADELRAKYGGRIYDRLKEMTTQIIFENDSYRE